MPQSTGPTTRCSISRGVRFFARELRTKRGRGDTVSEASEREATDANARELSPEETRRQARENWLRLSRDADFQRRVADDRGLSLDTEFDD